MLLQEYVDLIQSQGKAAFTSEEALRTMNISRNELSASVLRLKKKGHLIKPYQNFYVPLPPEYRSQGCIPADQLLPPLMKHIDSLYYVCLLSAGVYHGAAHQRPQITQVMAPKRILPIRCGSVAINFIFKKEMSYATTEIVNVRTGFLTVSTAETTAMDLLLYINQSGGINHIATVLTELIESIDPEKLLQLVKNSNEIVWVQRLGFLLEMIDPLNVDCRNKAVELLSNYIDDVKPAYAPMIPGDMQGFARNKKWRIVTNAVIESDI